MAPLNEKNRPIGRVLIVDDDRGVRTALSVMLQDEFIVQAVDSCAAGRSLLANEHFDVVVTDFEMPTQDGLSFLDYLRQSHPSIVGLLLTGRAENAKVKHANRDWARYRVLLKPIDPGALITAIRTGFHLARLRQSTGRLSGRLNR